MKKLLLLLLLTIATVCKSQPINLYLPKPTTVSDKEMFSCFVVVGVGIVANSIFYQEYNSYSTYGPFYSFRPRYGFISIGLGFVTIGVTGLNHLRKKEKTK